MIIVSRIIHVKVDRRLNVTNKFIYQRRLSSRLVIVMFRGTPCYVSSPVPLNVYPREGLWKIKLRLFCLKNVIDFHNFFYTSTNLNKKIHKN